MSHVWNLNWEKAKNTDLVEWPVSKIFRLPTPLLVSTHTRWSLSLIFLFLSFTALCLAKLIAFQHRITRTSKIILSFFLYPQLTSSLQYNLKTGGSPTTGEAVHYCWIQVPFQLPLRCKKCVLYQSLMHTFNVSPCFFILWYIFGHEAFWSSCNIFLAPFSLSVLLITFSFLQSFYNINTHILTCAPTITVLI